MSAPSVRGRSTAMARTGGVPDIADNGHRLSGDRPDVVRAWLRIAAECRPGYRGQVANRIDGAAGWFKYLSKHACRGVRHYQRQGKPAWWDRTGRMWGYSRRWPLVEAERAEITNPQMWRYRRMLRAYLVADARATARRYQLEGKPRKAAEVWDRVAFLRRLLKNPDRGESAFRGVSGWVPVSVQQDMLSLVGWDGTLKEAV